MDSNVLAVVVTVTVVPVVLRWLSRGPATAALPGTLAYGSRHKAFALAFLVVPCLLVALLTVAAPPKKAIDVLVPVALISFFAALASPLVIEFYRVSISFDEVGMHVSSPWSRRRTVAWRDVRKIRWRSVAKWFDLRADRGVVHISPWLVGLDAFATACKTHLPLEVLSRDEEAASVLVLMEQGRAGELVWANQRPTTLVRNRPG
jgi:hypothetical protein